MVRRAEKQKNSVSCFSAVFIPALSILKKVSEMSLEASGSARGSDLECVLVHCVQVCNKRVCVCIYRHAHMQLQLSCTSVCECEYAHVTSCVCERLGDVCSCAPVCACLRPCTLLWDSMATCAAPGPRLSVSAVTSSELSSSRPGTPAYPGPTDKAPEEGSGASPCAKRT